MPKAAEKQQSFEEAIAELEKIVNDLEDGDVALSEALNKFERGVALSAACQKQLDEAQHKVSVLLRGEDGAPVIAPMDAPAE